MPEDLARFGALIDRIYQGALEPGIWPVAIGEIAEWMEAPKASMFSSILPYENGGFTYDHNLSPELDEAWCRYQPEDLFTNRTILKGMDIQGNVILDRDWIAEDELFASSYYEEFLRIDDIPRMMTGVVCSSRSGDSPMTVCSVYRGRKHNPFDEADRVRYQLLMPHISRAVGTMFRLRAADRQVAASLAALDGLDRGVMLVDARAEIAFANRAALMLLAEGDGLRLRSLAGRNRWQLIAGHAAAQARIAALLRQAVDADQLAAACCDRPLAVPRPSGRSPYALQLSALPRLNDFGDFPGAAMPRAILFVTDTARPLVLDAATLTQLFGLTPSEARLAVELGDGIGLKEAADALGISLNTAKSQLTQVYQKTGVDNRARLMKLLAALANGTVHR